VDAHTGGMDAKTADQWLQIPITLMKSRTRMRTRIKMKSQIEIHIKVKKGIRIRTKVTRIHNSACDKTSGGRYKESLLQKPLCFSFLRIYAISCVTQRLSPLSIAAFLSL
jgi:hypothetical protein